jgi:DNA topoisomerase-1
MEEDLDGVARGERRWAAVMEEFYGPFAAALAQAEAAAIQPVTVTPASLPRDTDGDQSQVDSEAGGESCPQCGGKVIVREGKHGPFRACANFPRCRWRAPLAVGRCPKCGGDLVERRGKQGPFWGCANYPTCRYTQNPPPVERS